MFLDILKWKLDPSTKKLPPALIFFVTYKCNSRCRTCFYWKELNKPSELSLAEIKKVSASMGKLIWLHLSGGEPFLRKDLPEVVKVFYEQNKLENLGIPTNGLLPGEVEKMTREILEACPELNLSLLLSLDGLEKTHDSIRGVKGNFMKLIETGKRLTVLREKYSKLSVGACTTLCNQNYGEIPKLLEFAKNEMGLNNHFINLIRGEPMDKQLALPAIAEVEKTMELYREYSKYYYFEKSNFNPITARIAYKTNRYLNKIIIDSLKTGKTSIPCYAGEVGAVLEPNGEVKLCELTNSIGNLRNHDFDFGKLWFSEKAKQARKEIKCKDCCCTHALAQTRNILFNPALYPRILLQD